MNRIEKTLKITKRLIILAGVSLFIFGAVTTISLRGDEQRLMISWMTFVCGLLGGFVSIQQRLPKIGDSELDVLSRSWFQILLVPIYGGVFALVLYVLFLSGLIQGHLFPEFYIPQLPENTPPDGAFIKDFLWKTYPNSGEDFAKLIFWSFAAGFSERFVPQIISNVTSKQSESIPADLDKPTS